MIIFWKQTGGNSHPLPARFQVAELPQSGLGTGRL